MTIIIIRKELQQDTNFGRESEEKEVLPDTKTGSFL